MAVAAQKITLSSSRDIPFNKLLLSQSNVRRVKAGISVEELAEDIARRGPLLQSLNVRPVLDDAGAETGMYEVPAGGRRYQALALLVKQKRLAKTAPVPCVVRDPSTSILAEDDSLAENTQRVPLHPLDQFRAFLDMRTKGMTEEEIGGQSAEPEDEEEEDVIKPLPERLVIELTAHRTLALRDAVGANPQVAFTALLHKLVRDAFHSTSTSGASLQASIREVYFRDQGKDLGDTPYAKSVDQRHEDWKADLPIDEDALWDWLAALDEASRMALLAHCVAYGINALYERPNPYSATGVSQSGLDRRMAEADRLARATGLDMVDAGFRPTVENYLGRVPKTRILEAVREGAGEGAAQLIDHLKKADMAREAERLLADTGWLPELLRMADPDEVVAVDTQDGSAGAELPAFLAGDDEDEEATDDPEAEAMIAAE